MRFSGSFIRNFIPLFILSLSVVSCVISSNPTYYTANTDYHIVKPGENLSLIGRQYNISVDNLVLFNNLSSDTIFPGQKIYLKPWIRQKREYVTVRSIPASGYHIVRSKERITTISKMYDMSLIDLMDINNLHSFDLAAGQKIFLRRGTVTDKIVAHDEKKDTETQLPKPPDRDSGSKKTSTETIPKKSLENLGKNLPLKGTVSSEFGLRNGKPHKGIDVASDMGTPILAAMAGTVAYVGNQRGYGNVVILEHDNYIMTVYAHNESNLVREGDSVVSGQPIATLGDTGTTTGPHLHFEYRVRGVARDPRELFPDF
jgi:murein DD-endopeptidase MepM/ murein hydrolase activator NlpD